MFASKPWSFYRAEGDKAVDWDLATVVAEVGPEKTLQSCENDLKDIPYGPVREHLPGK